MRFPLKGGYLVTDSSARRYISQSAGLIYRFAAEICREITSNGKQSCSYAVLLYMSLRNAFALWDVRGRCLDQLISMHNNL